MAIPVIYKGDDTDFRGSTGFTLKVVTSSNLNLSGCTVEVEVLGFRRSFPASATGELVCPFAFTAAETQRMPLGIHAATVRVYDAKGRVRTINNSIRVKVTNSVHEAYGKDDPQEVTLAVSTVDLEAYAKKAEVTAAITAALKDAGASVKLHALTPEVTDTTVTLKPVDGKANYVADKVYVKGSVEITGCSIYIRNAYFYYYMDDEEHSLLVKDILIERCKRTDYFFDKNEHAGSWYYMETFKLRTLSDTECYTEDGDYFGTIPEGSYLEIQREGTLTDYDEYDGSENVIGDIYCDYFFGLIDIIDIGGSFKDYYFVGADTSSLKLTQEGSAIPDKSTVVSLPASTDSTNARRFTLTVETDTESEKSIEWQCGEVIEDVSGASKLVTGLNVWDVAEVAPGKFKVERASSPAQSAPLTLTASNGRVAELAVNDDLVLEVKEK